MRRRSRLIRPAAAGLVLAGIWITTATPASRGAAIERVLLDPERGTAEIVHARYIPPVAVDAEDAVFEFIAAHFDLYRLDRPEAELELRSRTTDRRGYTHFRYRQRYDGLPVWGCEIIAHRNADSEFHLFAGQLSPTPRLETAPEISPDLAGERATMVLRDRYPNEPLAASAELLVYPDGRSPKLAYRVEVTAANRGDVRWNVFIDAQTGAEIMKYDNLQSDGPAVGTGEDILGVPRSIQTYQIGTDYYLIDATHPMFVPPVADYDGVIVTYDDYYANGPAGVVVDPNGDNNFNDNIDLRAAVAGHLYAQLSYEYFLDTFGRNSFDDLGRSILVSVHDPKYVNNAYWNGVSLNFADGDGTTYRPWSGSLDVVAHELTHGVTEYTAGLIYTFQSGALNESYSDFFSAMVDRDDWLLAEEIRIPPPHFLRNLQDPHQGWDSTRFSFGYQPAHMSEFVDWPLVVDDGGVHINSGIPNKAGYLVAAASSREVAERIWFHTLTNYLTPSSDFGFWAHMTFEAAVALYGLPSPEVTAVADALDSVGLGGVVTINPDLEGLRVSLGNTLDTVVQLKNLSSQAVQVLSATTGLAELSVQAAFPIALGPGESATLPVHFDATSLDSLCDVREWTSGITFATDAPSTPLLFEPLTISIGYVDDPAQASNFSTAHTSLTVLSNPNILDYDLLYTSTLTKTVREGTLMVGLLDPTGKKVYRNAYGRNDFASVDNYESGLDSLNRATRTIRVATADGRIHGSVRYTFPEAVFAPFDYHLVDYTITNACDTPMTILVGVFTDFNMYNPYANFAGFDPARNLVYMYQASGSITCGWALLSGPARNLRAIPNLTKVLDGFTDSEAYDELNALANASGDSSDEWSVLLTFGEATLGAGDSVTYTAALLSATHGSDNLQNHVDVIKSWMCDVDLTGDVNVAGAITSADSISAVNDVFKGGPQPLPSVEAGDANCDRMVTSADVIYLVGYVFRSGPAPCDVCSNF